MKQKQTFFIKTFGCAANTADSERITSLFEEKGLKKVSSINLADNIVINTCMVRKSAEDRVYGLVKNLKENKERYPKNPKIILTGCMVGMAVKDKSGKLVKYLKKRIPQVDEFLPIEEVGFDIHPKRNDKDNALIPISNGCNNYCTYCVVPYSRGEEKSRLVSEIINECKTAASNGIEKVTLLGQNVNSYGNDLIKSGNYQINGKKVIPVMVKHLGKIRIPTLFPYLLEEISKIDGLKIISFLSSNPWDFSDELIKVIKHNPKLDRVIHLPVQSGDNEILKKMNRWYTVEEYENLVEKIKKEVRGVRFTTDIIVGFPGETEKQFENTVSLCKKIHFEKAYVSQYSDRFLTMANKTLGDSIDKKEKKRRWQILDRLINGKY